jgi:hypothetical protein
MKDKKIPIPHKDPIVRIIERTDEITRKELESTTPQPKNLPEEEKVELTLDEVANKFGIKVENLKIKK